MEYQAADNPLVDAYYWWKGKFTGDFSESNKRKKDTAKMLNNSKQDAFTKTINGVGDLGLSASKLFVPTTIADPNATKLEIAADVLMTYAPGALFGKGGKAIAKGAKLAKGSKLVKNTVKGAKTFAKKGGRKAISGAKIGGKTATRGVKGVKSLSKSGLKRIKKLKQKGRIRRLKAKRFKKGSKFSKTKLALGGGAAAAMFSGGKNGRSSGIGNIDTRPLRGGNIPGGYGGYNSQGDKQESNETGGYSTSIATSTAVGAASASKKKRISGVNNPTISIGNKVLTDDKFECGCDNTQDKIKRKKFRSNVVSSLESIRKSEKSQAEDLEESNEKVQNAGFGDEQENFITNAIPSMQSVADAAASKVSLWSMLGPAVAAGLFALYHWWASGGLGSIFEWVTGFVKDAFNSLMAPFYEWWDKDISPFLSKIGSTINVIVEKIDAMIPDSIKDKFNSNLSDIDPHWNDKNVRAKYSDYKGVKQFGGRGIINTSSGVLTKRIKGESANSSRRNYVGRNNQPWMARGINSEFGNTNGRSSPHRGVDFRAPIGTKIQSVSSGVVSYLNNFKHGGGNVMFVTNKETGDRVSYLHLSKRLVKAGVEVAPGDIIAESGNTAWVDKNVPPHIHIGVKSGGKYVDPLTYINSLETTHVDNTQNIAKLEGGDTSNTTINQSSTVVKAAPPGTNTNDYVTTEKLSKVMDNVSVKLNDANRLAIEGSMQQTPTVLSARYNYNKHI